MGGSASVQLAMLGLDKSGKTTLLYRMKFNQYMETNPTIGYNCEKIKGYSEKTKGFSFKIWDVCGEDRVRPLWITHLRSCDGIIFVVDSADKERLEEAKLELIKIVRNKDNPGLPILVIANKQDLRESLSVDQVEKFLGLRDLNPGQLWASQEACAINGEGLEDCMDVMLDMIEKRKKSKTKR